MAISTMVRPSDQTSDVTLYWDPVIRSGCGGDNGSVNWVINKKNHMRTAGTYGHVESGTHESPGHTVHELSRDPQITQLDLT